MKETQSSFCALSFLAIQLRAVSRELTAQLKTAKVAATSWPAASFELCRGQLGGLRRFRRPWSISLTSTSAETSAMNSLVASEPVSRAVIK
jgi:hypothetical protein